MAAVCKICTALWAAPSGPERAATSGGAAPRRRSSARTMSSTLLAIKAASQARDATQKRDTDLHKAALVLAREYLRANGYARSVEALRLEVGAGLEKLDLADNVDLGSVVRDHPLEDEHPRSARTATTSEWDSAHLSHPDVRRAPRTQSPGREPAHTRACEIRELARRVGETGTADSSGHSSTVG